MDFMDALTSFISQFPNLAGFSILSLVLYRVNTRLMDFQERIIANLTDDIEHIRHDVKRIKDKLGVVE